MKYVKPDVDLRVEWSSRADYESAALTQIPDGRGVYLLQRLLPNRRWRLFYVGQGEVRARLQSHRSPDEPNECIRTHLENHKCRFEYALVEDENVLSGILPFLIQTYGTLDECNDTLPEVKPVSVNLPD